MSTNQPFRTEGDGILVQQRQGAPVHFWTPGSAPTYSSGLTAVSSITPTTDTPADAAATGRKVIDLAGDREFWMELFSTEADAASIDWQIFGWKADNRHGADNVELWTPHQLAIGTAAVGPMTGVAGSTVPADWRFVEGFAATTDRTESPGVIHETVVDAIGWLYMRVAGYMKLEIQLSGATGLKVNGRYWTK